MSSNMRSVPDLQKYHQHCYSLTGKDIQSSKHGMSKAIRLFFTAKVETVHLSTVTPLMECWRSLVVLEAFEYGTVNHHLHNHLYIISIIRNQHQQHIGITLSSDLSWEAHINAICTKVAPRLYYLKQLRRAGLPSGDSLYFYLTVIRPVLEYGCIAWHHGLTVAQSQNWSLCRRGP